MSSYDQQINKITNLKVYQLINNFKEMNDVVDTIYIDLNREIKTELKRVRP